MIEIGIILIILVLCFIGIIILISKAPISDENEQPVKPIIKPKKPIIEPKKENFSKKNLRNELEKIYNAKREACKNKKIDTKPYCNYGGLWQRLKAKQKNNK